MDNNQSNIRENFVVDFFDILLDEKRIDFFDDKELSKVKDIIANSYHSNHQITQQISNNQRFRHRFGSTELITNIINDFPARIKEELEPSYYVTDLVILNSFEDEYFDKLSFGNCLTLILELIKESFAKYNILKPDEKELKETYHTLFNNLHELFVRTNGQVDIDSKNTQLYQNLYNQIKTIFVAKGYKNAEVFFKFFYEYAKNNEGNVINKNDINNCMYQFLATRNLSAQKIKAIITDSLSIQDFFENAAYKTEIFNRAKTEINFIETFYEDYDENEKQQLLIQWIPSNGNKDINQFEGLLDNLDYKIPNVPEFADNILSSTDRSTNLIERGKLYDIFFKLSLPEQYDNKYSKQIISSICSTDISVHNFGLNQYSIRNQFVKTEELKESAVPFLFTIITNLNAYHEIFENILNLKIGIDKRHFDKQICDTTNCVAHISDYLVQSGDLSFYKTITTKLLDYTIGIIKERFISGANCQPKYLDMLKYINGQSTTKNLPEDILNKLKSLLSESS